MSASHKHATIMSMNRRDLLQRLGGIGAAGTAALLAAPARSATAGPGNAAALKGPYLDLTTGVGNKTAMARMSGDLDTAKQKQSWFSGVVMAVRLDADIEDLFGFEGLSSSRIQVQTTAPI